MDIRSVTAECHGHRKEMFWSSKVTTTFDIWKFHPGMPEEWMLPPKITQKQSGTNILRSWKIPKRSVAERP